MTYGVMKYVVRSVGGTIAIVIMIYCDVVSNILLFRTVSTAVHQGCGGFLFLISQNSLSSHLSFQQAIKRKQRTQTRFKTLINSHRLRTPAFRHAYLR
jgi:hypothetical protein